MKLQENMSGIK